jgi:hypothetical protein
MNTKKAAFDTAHGKYLMRACGFDAGDKYTTYTGDMDIQAFVDTCPVPSTPDLEVHRGCWAEMRRLFEIEWAKHERAHG